MITMYKIVKSTRLDSSPPYNGMTIDRCGLSRPLEFINKQQAEEAATKMTKYNPVGFKVVEMREWEYAHD
jgi:hypothetical protein